MIRRVVVKTHTTKQRVFFLKIIRSYGEIAELDLMVMDGQR